MLYGGDSGVKVVACGGGDADETGVAEDAVACGEVGFLLEDVVVFGGLARVFDLSDLLTLRGVRDVLGLLLADVAGGLVGAHRGAQQGEGSLDAVGEQDGCEEPWVDH
ncbi:hypothetical protein SDC9_152592 [bioreactor metagenome]|uniref:Uncharacterized protein n=1 Tax=bioreactor metagenome TaxID=1076179 RepID=A0A645EVT8_9ZZZZ